MARAFTENVSITVTADKLTGRWLPGLRFVGGLFLVLGTPLFVLGLVQFLQYGFYGPYGSSVAGVVLGGFFAVTGYAACFYVYRLDIDGVPKTFVVHRGLWPWVKYGAGITNDISLVIKESTRTRSRGKTRQQTCRVIELVLELPEPVPHRVAVCCESISRDEAVAYESIHRRAIEIAAVIGSPIVDECTTRFEPLKDPPADADIPSIEQRTASIGAVLEPSTHPQELCIALPPAPAGLFSPLMTLALLGAFLAFGVLGISGGVSHMRNGHTIVPAQLIYELFVPPTQPQYGDRFLGIIYLCIVAGFLGVAACRLALVYSARRTLSISPEQVCLRLRLAGLPVWKQSIRTEVVNSIRRVPERKGTKQVVSITTPKRSVKLPPYPEETAAGLAARVAECLVRAGRPTPYN